MGGTIYGSESSGGNLTLGSTSHASKGGIIALDTVYGSTSASGNLTLATTTNATKGIIVLDTPKVQASEQQLMQPTPQDQMRLGRRRHTGSPRRPDEFMRSTEPALRRWALQAGKRRIPTNRRLPNPQAIPGDLDLVIFVGQRELGSTFPIDAKSLKGSRIHDAQPGGALLQARMHRSDPPSSKAYLAIPMPSDPQRQSGELQLPGRFPR
jgi:hypothetical protein